MGIISDFVGRLGIGNKGSVETEQKAASLETGSDAFASSLGGNFNENFSSFNNQKQQLQSYVEWVYAASSAIAEHCAAIDFRLYQNNTKIKNVALGQKLIYYPKEVQRIQRSRVNVIEQKDGKLIMRKQVSPLEELESHPLLDLLHNPNPFMVKNEFLEITFLHLMLTGDAFWAINRGKKNKPAEMWPLMPDRVTVVPDKTKFLLGYLYQINGEQVPFAPDDIIHHKLANPTNFHRGYSPIMAGARTIDADSHASDWNRRVMYNSATPNGVFKTDAKLDDKVFKRLKDEIMNTFAGASNHGRPAVLEQGLDFKPISMNQKDMDFLNLRKFSRDQILSLLGVPKSILGLDESMSRANAESAEYVFSKRNRNKMQRLTNRITEDLAIQFGSNLIVSFTDPVPDDKEFLLKETEASLGQGIPWRSANEARAERGDDPVEGGDELYIDYHKVPMGQPEPDPALQGKPSVATESDAEESGDEEDPGSDDGSGDNTDNAADNNSSAGGSGSTTSETTNSPGGQVQAGFTATQLKQLRELIGEATKSTKTEQVPKPIVVVPKKKIDKFGPNREVPDGYTLCLCCMGWGEHNTGYECYRCDGGGIVTTKEDEQPMPCDGAYEDGNGGRGQKQQKERKTKTPAFLASIELTKLPSFPESIAAITSLAKQADTLPEFPPSLPAPEVLSESESKPANAIPPTADDEAAETSTKLEINDAMANWLSRRAKLVDGSEKRMIREAMEHFLLQKHEVLSNLNRLTDNAKAVGKRKVKEAKKEMNNLFDKAASATAWATALGPVYSNLSLKAGNDALDLVNDPQKFGYEAEAPETPFTYDANTAPIKQYFTERAGTVSQGIDAETDKQLRATLTEGLNAGESLQELSDRVEGIYNAAAGYRAMRIARTETQSALHFASGQAWEQSGVVENYIWLTAADPCKLLCAFVANTVAKKPDGFKVPGGGVPCHPNDRCEVVPYTVSGVKALDNVDVAEIAGLPTT